MSRQGVFIFIAVIAIIAGLSMVVYGNLNTSSTAPNTTSTVSLPETPTANILEVPDQPAGSVVKVSKADLTRSGFVVIKDTSGKTIGVSVLLSASKNSLVFVTASTLKGKTYYAYLYADNGDSKFDNNDDILADSSGSQLKISFKVL